MPWHKGRGQNRKVAAKGKKKRKKEKFQGSHVMQVVCNKTEKQH